MKETIECETTIKISSHQYRLDKDAMKKSNKKLQVHIEEIRNCKDFECIYVLISKYTEKIKGLGSLYYYDVSLRIGWYLNILPDKVHLHAGALEGAKMIDKKFKFGAYKKTDFPYELYNKLKPYQIEAFLCLCMKHTKSKC
ncbi:MAG: hypothetical protein GQ570_10020 [Helicobacteraceae bacterium]|nr:hypothetical protein [Helicobacteraceae bacterium]